jgi:hypothetical protein
VTQQPGNNIFHAGQCRSSIGFFLNNFDHDHIFRLTKDGQRIGDGSPTLRRVLPGDQNAPQIEPINGIGNNKQRPSRLHQQIARIDPHEWIRRRVLSVLAYDNDVGCARLLDDKSGRKILGAGPFNGRCTALHRRAELGFNLGHSIPDRSLALVEHPLSRLSRREVKWRAELTCGCSNRISAEMFGQLASDLKACVIRKIQCQADHHCLICHSFLPTLIDR